MKLATNINYVNKLNFEDYKNTYDSISSHYDTLMLDGYYDYDSLCDSLNNLLPINSTILEIGVGTGINIEKLVKKNSSRKFVGVDYSNSMLEICKFKLGSEVNLYNEDVAELNLGKTYDSIFCVGGVWYFIRNDNDSFQLCSHIPDDNRNLQSFHAVSSHLKKGAKLILSIQGPHNNYSNTLSNGVIYQQIITKIENHFEKKYIFKDGDNVINSQVCLYRLHEHDDAIKMFKKAGLEFVSLDESNQFFIFKKL